MLSLRLTCRMLLAGAVLAMLPAALEAQTPQPPAVPPSTGPGGTSVSILHLNVVNLDRSIALFRDALGFEVTTPPAAPRSGAALVGASGATLRTAILKAPDSPFSLELVEWLGTELRPQKARIQDPGAVMLAITVDDIDARLAALRRQPGTRVLTAGGRPYVAARPGGENRAVMVEDENGFVIELVQNVPATAPGVSIYLTVADLAQTVSFYNKVIGFTMMEPAAAAPVNERVSKLFDNPSLGTMRVARGTFPGSSQQIFFQEFGAADRRPPLRHRVQDPGGPIFTMTVNDFPAVMAAVRANGGLIGDGETSATLPPDARQAWVRDPNGLLIRMAEPQGRRGGGVPGQ